LLLFFALIIEETASIMSCNNQIFAKKSKDLVSKEENISKSIQRLQAFIFELSNMIDGLAESSFKLENGNIAYDIKL